MYKSRTETKRSEIHSSLPHSDQGWPLDVVFGSNTALQILKKKKKSTTNRFRKCFILNCCWFEDGIITINTFQFLSLSQVKSGHRSSCVSGALTSPAARAVWQKCGHAEAAEDAGSTWAQGLNCINSALERGPTKICVKATMLCLTSYT